MSSANSAVEGGSASTETSVGVERQGLGTDPLAGSGGRDQQRFIKGLKDDYRLLEINGIKRDLKQRFRGRKEHTVFWDWLTGTREQPSAHKQVWQEMRLERQAGP